MNRLLKAAAPLCVLIAINASAQVQIGKGVQIGFTGGATPPSVAGSGQSANIDATGLFTSGDYNSQALGGLPATLISPACPSAQDCNIFIPQVSSDTTLVTSLLNTQSHLHIKDQRFGQNIETFVNSGSYASSPSGIPLGYGHTCVFTLTPAIATGFSERNCQQDNEVNSGSGVNTGTSAGSPFGATNQWSQAIQHLNNFFSYMSGINQQYGNVMYCFKAGDCAQEDNIMFYRSGCLQASDECVEHKVFNTQEANPPFGTVTSHTGNFVLNNFTQNGNNAAQGLPLIDYTATGPSGLITGQTENTYPVLNTVTTSDTHAVSTAIGTFNGNCGAVTIPDQPANVVCATTTTSGAFVSGVVTIGDSANIEQSNLTVSGGTLTYTMTKPHPAGTPIYQGGLAGYVIIMGNGYPDIPTLLAKNSPAIHLTSYFIAGSPTANTYAIIVPYKNNQNGQLGFPIPAVTSVPINGEVRLSGGATTITPNGNSYYVYNNLAATQAPLEVIAVTGAGTGFNETVTNPTADAAGIHFVSTTTTPGTSTGGTISVTGLNNYFTAPYADVLQVMDVTMGQFGFPVLSGRLEVAPNVAPWTTNDLVIQSNGDSEQPRPVGIISNGTTPSLTGPNLTVDIGSGGEAYSGATIFRIDTLDDAFLFKGLGGTYDGHIDVTISDLSAIDFDVTNQPLPNGSVIHVGCTIGCTGPNIAPYNYLNLQTNFGPLTEQFFPSTGDRIYDGLYEAFTLKTALHSIFNPSDFTEVNATVSNNTEVLSTATGFDDATLTTGTMVASQITAGATTPTVVAGHANGTLGSTTYTYVMASQTATGETLPTGTSVVTNGNAVLGGPNTISLAAGGQVGAQNIAFYRTSSTGGLSPAQICISPAAAGTCFDSGQAGLAIAPQTSDTSGAEHVGGPLSVAGALTVGTAGGTGSHFFQIFPNTFSVLATCGSSTEGTQASVTDSSTNTWGATVTGGGALHVLTYCDGTNWTVAGK